MLKIAYIHQYFGTNNGSWSTRPYEFCKRWVAKGHNVTVITSPYYKTDIVADGFISTIDLEGIKVKVVNAPDSNLYGFWKRVVNAILFSISTTFLVLFNRYDIVISSSGPITTGFAGLLAKLMRRSKFVFEVRDLWPEGGVQMGLISNKFNIRMAYSFESILYRNADLVVALSQGMCDDILFRHPNTKTTVITNASDPNYFQDLTNVSKVELPEKLIGKRLFVYFGSLGLMDACDEIIDGFFLLRNRSDVGLIFIGEGSERARLVKRVIELNLEDKVHFIGLVSKDVLKPWLSNCLASFVVFKDISVLSTVSPNKMFDSFAAGLPIIHNTSGWIADLVSQNNCGITVKSRNSQEMADAMIKMLDNDVFRNEAKKSAVLLSKGVYNYDTMSNKYLVEMNNMFI